MAGAAVEPDPDAVTLTVTDALLVPLYVAVIVPLPNGNCKPFTASVAVAVPADPVNAADPNEVPPIEKETDPDGVVPVGRSDRRHQIHHVIRGHRAQIAKQRQV